ncbi:hypothetical protein LEMLEM_LOCUS21288 [Lemmus lemmus]
MLLVLLMCWSQVLAPHGPDYITYRYGCSSTPRLMPGAM